MRTTLLVLFAALLSLRSAAADAPEILVQKIKAKLEHINDYVADGKMKTDVAFIKAPTGKVRIYYKKPNKIKLVREHGISILPKNGLNINTSNILDLTNYDAIDAGIVVVDGISTRRIRILPRDVNSDIVVMDLYIDETNLLIRKSASTTKDNGSYEIEMFYGTYASQGLPDKVVFSFNVKDYKIPKGISLDFDDNLKPAEKEKMKNKKGKVEFIYTHYTINQGVDDKIFK